MYLTPTEVAKRAVYDQIKVIDDAAQSLDELYEQFPETREMVAQLREIGVIITDDKLTEDDYWYEGKLAATFFARYRKLVDTRAIRRDLLRVDGEPSAEAKAVERLDGIIGGRAGRPAGQALLHFLQRKVLSEVYHLDTAHMIYVVENFGPVDWRMVDAQSLYWVSLGLIRGGHSATSFQTDVVNTIRLIHFSLRNLFHRNRMSFEPNPESIHTSYINCTPDINFIEPMHRSYITYGPMMDPDPGDVVGAGSIFRTGHINFLTEAIRMLYFADRLVEAEHYYEYLRTHYGRQEHGGKVERRFTLPLRDFVLKTFYGDITGIRETNSAIQMLLYRAYIELANEEIKRYNRYTSKALDLWEAYMKEKAEFRTSRLKLSPFQNYQIDVFREMLAEPANEVTTIRKVRLWRVAPNHLKQWVYDDLRDGFARECELWDFGVDKAFPEPLEMEQFRAAHPRRDVEQPEKTADTPAQSPG